MAKEGRETPVSETAEKVNSPEIVYGGFCIAGEAGVDISKQNSAVTISAQCGLYGE